ncbi:MAG TPA: chemotaxis protein CheB [Anaeromyxobacter sp.]|nr:chemotaxis protein CheB [Anaeromyxobacter sp.]
MAQRDIVVVGASAGGVDLLLDLAGELPSDFPAAVFVVIHTAPGFVSSLPELLSGRGPLRATHPVHGAEIAPGRIYVAPADNHMLVRQGYVEVVRGPRENGHRPAVDPLFRSASWAYGSRVIGVVLSGYLDCGTAGMMSVKARGGLAVVQDPSTAVAPGMPRSALERVEVDHVVKPAELPGLLMRLTRQEAGVAGAPTPAIDALEGRKNGTRAELVCPACHGVLTETDVGEFRHFRCHVGHAFSLESLLSEQSEDVERALWAAVRSLEESAALSRRMSRTQSDRDLRRRFSDKEQDLSQQAEVIRRILLQGRAQLEPTPASEERQ